MKVKKKSVKILFNSLMEYHWGKNVASGEKYTPFYSVGNILKYTIKLKKTERFLDIKGNKFCFLESINFEEVADADSKYALINGLFKSARNEFRPNLINKKTGDERKNPKLMTEGDIEMTHFLIRIDENRKEVFFLLESNFHGVTVNNVLEYLKKYTKRYLISKELKLNFSIRNHIIPRENFLGELTKLKRAKVAEVLIDKKMLGSEGLNFSNRIISLKKELKLTLSSEIGESIKEVGIDLFNRFNSAKSDISKIRIIGTDSKGDNIVLDTSFMNKVEFVEVDLNNETGEINSMQMITGLKEISIKL